MSSNRMDDGKARGAAIRITVDGEPWTTYAGETVAGALLAGNRAHFRRTPTRGQPRGYYCGMGVCWECALVVDGRPNVRACMTHVADGMRVETQDGDGPKEVS